MLVVRKRAKCSWMKKNRELRVGGGTATNQGAAMA
jgi:hypothetical protein